MHPKEPRRTEKIGSMVGLAGSPRSARELGESTDFSSCADALVAALQVTCLNGERPRYITNILNKNNGN